MALKGMRINAKGNMHYGSTRVEFDSIKNSCKVVSQSMLEYIEFMRLEFDPKVINYVPHPGTITIQDDQGREHRSVFDAEVLLDDGTKMYEEVKYLSELENGNGSDEDAFRSIRQISIQEEWCRQKGYKYKVVTDDDLLKPALLNNLIYINQRLRPERIDDMSEIKGKAASIYQRIINNNGKIIISALSEEPSDTESIMTAVCYLLKQGLIEADLNYADLYLGSEVRIYGK